jgi:hypothetical protein
VKPLELAIVDALARARRAGREPTSIYLSAEDREALGLEPGSVLGGLPIRAAARKSKVYCSHGESHSIASATARKADWTKRSLAKSVGRRSGL